MSVAVAAVLAAQTFVRACASSQLPAPRVVATHRLGGTLTCAMCRHDTQSRLSNAPPPTPSVTDTAAVFSTTQTSAPIGLTNPCTLIHTASFAEEDQ